MNTVFHVGSGTNQLDKTKVTWHQRDKHMIQQKQLIKAMPIDEHCYYYTVKSRKNHALKAENQKVAPFPDLTDREREVLNLIASGENNQDISQ